MTLATDKQTDDLGYQINNFYRVSDGEGWTAYGFGTHDEACKYQICTGNEVWFVGDWNEAKSSGLITFVMKNQII